MISIVVLCSVKVSVVMSAFNAEDYLDQCISSIIAQTLKDIEIILIDDGSTDRTLSIMKQYETKDSRVKVISKSNGGAGSGRNVGLKHSCGKYVIFLDADDFFDSKMLEVMYEYSESNHLDMAICHAYEYDNRKSKVIRIMHWATQNEIFDNKIFSYVDNPKMIFQSINTWAWNKLILKSVIEENHLEFQEIKSSNDNVFVTSLLVLCKRISILQNPLVYYRTNNPKSLQRTKEKTWYCLIESAIATKKSLVQHGVFDEVEQSCVNKIIKNAVYYYKSIKNPIIKKKMERSISYELFDEFKFDKYPDDYFYDKENISLLKKIRDRCFSKKIIPIVLASDNNSAKMMYVTILSILNTKSEDTGIDFHLLIHSDLNNKYKKDISKICEIYDNVEVNYHIMDGSFCNADLTIGHTISPTYYCLAIPIIFSDIYDKCIYLDADTIVEKDLIEFFSIDLNRYYAAGVKSASYIMCIDNHNYLQSIGINDVDNYTDAGVLLINLDKIKNEMITKKLFDMASNDYKSENQDVINIVFNGKILNIPLRYNLMTKYDYSSSSKKYIQLNKIYGEKEITDAIKDPTIIHYTDENKPWDNKQGQFFERWWYYANKTPYFFNIRYYKNKLIKSIKSMISNEHKKHK